MGYRGKLRERERARELRVQAWTINEVSVWVRDVEFDEVARKARSGVSRQRGARNRGPNRLQQRKQAEIEELMVEGRERIGQLSKRDLLVAGAFWSELTGIPLSQFDRQASPIARYPIRAFAGRSIRWGVRASRTATVARIVQ